MKSNIMITDGGPHSVEKWAEATASQVIDIAEDAAGERRAQAVKLEAAIIDILEQGHRSVQDGERAKLGEHGAERYTHDVNPEHHLSLDETIAAIVSAASVTPWAGDFNSPELQTQLRVVLSSHFATSMQIERNWHADRNGG